MRAEQGAISDLVTPWIICYAIACVVSLIAIFLKLKVFYRQLRWARLHVHAAVSWTCEDGEEGMHLGIATTTSKGCVTWTMTLTLTIQKRTTPI